MEIPLLTKIPVALMVTPEPTTKVSPLKVRLALSSNSPAVPAVTTLLFVKSDTAALVTLSVDAVTTPVPVSYTHLTLPTTPYV